MCDLMRNMRGEGRTDPRLSGRVRDPRPLTPPSGTPRMVSRAPPTHQLRWDRLGARLGVTTWWEEDHVIAGAERHELCTPKHHDGAEAEWVESVCHPDFPQLGKINATQKAPTWRANCWRLDSWSRHK